jgi:hypothetical protein
MPVPTLGTLLNEFANVKLIVIVDVPNEIGLLPIATFIKL